MPPRIVERLLVKLHLREERYEKYDYDAHMHLEAQGFFNEGLEGTYNCPSKSCKNLIYVYRQVRRQDTSFHDVLRFEQTIPAQSSSKKRTWINSKTGKPNASIVLTSPGKVSMTVPVVWNTENRKEVTEKEYVGEVKKVNGKTYTLVKHKHFASVECVVCKEELHVWDELRRYEGEEGMRWFLARKEGNASQKDIEGGGSETDTLVNFDEK